MLVAIQNQSGDEIIRALRNKQEGKGYGAEGTCVENNWVYAVVYFYVPFATIPTVELNNVQYYNASGAEVWKKSKYAFIVRATVSSDGGAGLEFGWEATK